MKSSGGFVAIFYTASVLYNRWEGSNVFRGTLSPMDFKIHPKPNLSLFLCTLKISLPRSIHSLRYLFSDRIMLPLRCNFYNIFYLWKII